MTKVRTLRPHGVGVRGADLSRSSPLFQGRFGRMFRALPPADFGPDDPASVAALNALGAAMVSVPDPADPKDGADNEESGIPAVYTYFGSWPLSMIEFGSFPYRMGEPTFMLVAGRNPRPARNLDD